MSFTSWTNDIAKIDVLSLAKNKLSPAFVFLLSRNFRLQICTDACAETLDVHCDMCLHDLLHSSEFEQSAAGTMIALQ